MNLKIKIGMIVLFLAIMATLPLAVVRCNSFEPKTGNKPNAESNAQANSDYNKILCGLVLAKVSEDCDDEAIKATAILINTDYYTDKNSFDLSDEEIFIDENIAESSNIELYNRVQKIVNSNLELYITYSNKICYIPYSDSSNGATYKSDKYEYIDSVASPWDCFETGYDEAVECVGASLSGIKYLCSKGYTAEQALEWYLPKLEVTKL